jgi:hypothetical protein
MTKHGDITRGDGRITVKFTHNSSPQILIWKLIVIPNAAQRNEESRYYSQRIIKADSNSKDSSPPMADRNDKEAGLKVGDGELCLN